MTDSDFWLGLWERGRVPFHARTTNPFLAAHFAALALPPGARVFVPLCGQTVDIGWLRARGFRPVGAELSPLAVAQLFDSLGEQPEITPAGPLTCWRARDVEVFAGDIFDLTPAMLGPVDAVYDRAALIALPPDMRARYAAHMLALAGTAPQLLLSYVNPGTPYPGPPFPVEEAEIRRLYGAVCRVTQLSEAPDDGGEIDQVWRLDPRPA